LFSTQLTLKSLNSLVYEKISLGKLHTNNARIKILSTSICASDFPRIKEGKTYIYPIVLGHEFMGEIIEMNNTSEVDLKKGNIVSVFPLIPCKLCSACHNEKFNLCKKYSYLGSRVNGGFAEYLDVPIWNLFRTNSNWPENSNCLLEPMAVAHNAISKCLHLKVKKHIKIAIFGYGFMGLVLSYLAKIYFPNSSIFVFDRNQHKLSKGPIDIKRQKFDFSIDDNIDENLEFDLIFETIGSENSLLKSLGSLKSNGQLVTLGNPRIHKFISAAFFDSLNRKEIIIQGVWNSKFKNGFSCDWTAIDSLVQNSQLNPKNLMGHIYNFRNLKNYLESYEKTNKTNLKDIFVNECI
jgi:L-iditol 2-dehydrogenase